MINLLLFYFLILVVIAFFFHEESKFRLIIFVLLGISMICIAAFRIPGCDHDYKEYVKMFTLARHWSDLLNVEPSFIFISKIVSSSLMLFLVYAILGVTLKFIAIKELTNLWFLVLILYFSKIFILHDMTQIRVGVASGLLLLCIKPIYDRDWKRFLLFALLAILFHYSALVILPMWFLRIKPKKFIWILAIPVAYLIYFSKIDTIATIPIPSIQEKIEVYQKLVSSQFGASEKTNLFNLVFLAQIVIFYFLVYFYDPLIKRNKYLTILLNIQALSLIVYPIFAILPVLAARMHEFLGVVEIITMPLLYYCFKPRIFGKIIVIIIACVFIYLTIFYNSLIK